MLPQAVVNVPMFPRPAFDPLQLTVLNEADVTDPVHAAGVAEAMLAEVLDELVAVILEEDTAPIRVATLKRTPPLPVTAMVPCLSWQSPLVELLVAAYSVPEYENTKEVQPVTEAHIDMQPVMSLTE